MPELPPPPPPLALPPPPPLSSELRCGGLRFVTSENRTLLFCRLSVAGRERRAPLAVPVAAPLAAPLAVLLLLEVAESRSPRRPTPSPKLTELTEARRESKLEHAGVPLGGGRLLHAPAGGGRRGGGAMSGGATERGENQPVLWPRPPPAAPPAGGGGGVGSTRTAPAGGWDAPGGWECSRRPPRAKKPAAPLWAVPLPGGEGGGEAGEKGGGEVEDAEGEVEDAEGEARGEAEDGNAEGDEGGEGSGEV